MKFDLFVSDYDGTLGFGENINEASLDAIKEFVNRGGKFAVCTGRPYSSIYDICIKHGLNILVASYQGSSIRDVKTEEVIFAGGIDCKKSAEIVKRFYEDGFGPVVFIDDVMYYQGFSKYAELYRHLDNVPKIEVPDIYQHVINTGKPALKIVFATDDDKADNVRVEYEKELAEKYGVMLNSGGKGLVEVINPKLSKGNAVRYLAKHFNIPLDKVITVGDFNNDIELVAGGPWHGVAVAGGHPDLLKVAKEITVPYSGNPVKTLLEKYCLK